LCEAESVRYKSPPYAGAKYYIALQPGRQI
jgi:hypothetical protein